VVGRAPCHGRSQLAISCLYPMVQSIVKERIDITYVSSSWGGAHRPMGVDQP
jgi:hypothetical protein